MVRTPPVIVISGGSECRTSTLSGFVMLNHFGVTGVLGSDSALHSYCSVLSLFGSIFTSGSSPAIVAFVGTEINSII